MRQKLTHFISHYFELSRKEANGFILLCCILLLFILLPAAGYFWPSSLRHSDPEDQRLLDSLAALLESSPIGETASASPGITPQFSYTYFDPNHSSEKEMILAGVPVPVSKRIIKFRHKGGIFKQKEDLQKIYGLSTYTYQKLFPYIHISAAAKVVSRPSRHYSPPASSPSAPFDLNTADSSDLEALKGIGPVLASRIIKYRNKLGGFIHPGQLEEIYGLDSTVVQRLHTCGYIDKAFVPSKINLNALDEKSFQGHPYLDRKSIRWIVRYRTQHGDFTSPEQLRNIQPFSEETLLKILPYLTTDNY